MTIPRGPICRTHQEASLVLNELIKMKCGDDPDAIESYEVRVHPCRETKTTGSTARSSWHGRVARLPTPRTLSRWCTATPF